MGGLLSAAIKYIPSVPASGAAWAFVRNCPDSNTNLSTRISLNSATSNVNYSNKVQIEYVQGVSIRCL